MRVLCIHPINNYNPGDLMTYYGAKHILQMVFNDVEFLQFDIKRAEAEVDTYIPEYNWGMAVDMIMLAGSPWIGRNAHSIKRKFVNQAKNRWPDARKIALGIGSFLSITCMVNKDYSGIFLDFLNDFDLITVRDVFAHQILSQYNINNELALDTAYYFPVKKPLFENKRPVLIYYDPLKNDVVSHLNKEVWETYVMFQLSWLKQYNAEAIVVTSGDGASLQEKNIKYKLVTDLDWLSSRMSKADAVMSGRVHMAILSSISGCRHVSLLPVDSRYATISNSQIKIVQPYEKYLFPTISNNHSNLIKRVKKFEQYSSNSS